MQEFKYLREQQQQLQSNNNTVIYGSIFMFIVGIFNNSVFLYIFIKNYKQKFNDFFFLFGFFLSLNLTMFIINKFISEKSFIEYENTSLYNFIIISHFIGIFGTLNVCISMLFNLLIIKK